MTPKQVAAEIEPLRIDLDALARVPAVPCRWYCAPDLKIITNRRSDVVSLDKMGKVVF